MLKRRLIPTLLLRNGRMVKGVNFDKYRDTGDPVYASKVYNSQYVDELIIVDVPSSTARKIDLEVNKEINLFFSRQDARIYST